MRLLALCLMPLLTAQDPAPETTPPSPDTTATTPATTPTDDAAAPPQGGELERLQAAERAGTKADPDVLRALACGDDAAIAARAAWLLGRCEAAGAIDQVREVATGSRHATARLQAMHTLVQKAQVASFQAAVTALEDQDRAVRTLAAQLIGKLRRPAGTAPLVALVERGERPTDGPATDLQAALLALQDLGAADQLLRVATALNDRPANGTGEALTWCFQQLAPKLAQEPQVTLLLAALDHREPLLRRYVIGRLGELGVRSTAQALEGRLAQETAELRPLVEVALQQVRGDDRPQPTDEFERAVQNAKALAVRLQARWNGMSTQDRAIAGSIPIALLLVVVVMGQLRRRRARADATAAALALVAPSEEHLEQLAAEAEELAAAAEQEAIAADAEEPAAALAGDTDGWGEPTDATTDEADVDAAGHGRR
ncbi:MAG: hypothetical protein JNL08_10105 [Planctomycetes bacterium]|nr:hypothetical protein [Planctomycetota bacterium]